MKKKSISERAIIGFDHGLQAEVFVYWVPRAMFFTRHGRPWSTPTTKHGFGIDPIINSTVWLAERRNQVN